MKKSINLFTIGFTKKSAEKFFQLLLDAGVKRIIDTRLNNTSQLSGFAKQNDLKFFLNTIGEIDYVHLTELAPTKDILDSYKKKKIDWQTYESKFNHLINQRKIENIVSYDFIENSCLLCSEAKPHHCHRRLVAEYFKKKLSDSIDIHHL